MKKPNKRFLIFVTVFFCAGLLMHLTGKALGGEGQVRDVVYTVVDKFAGAGHNGQVYIGNEGIHIGGSHGIHITNEGISIGGSRGVYIGPEGIYVGGLSSSGVTYADVSVAAVEGAATLEEDAAIGYFSCLDADIDLGDIYLISGEKYTVSAAYPNQDCRIKWGLDGDTLKIWSEGDWSSKQGKDGGASVWVTVPTYVALKEVDLSTDLGDVTVELEGVRCVEADLSTNLGNIVCTGLAAQDLDAESDLGNVTVTFPARQGVSYELSADLGSVDVEDIHRNNSKAVFSASPQKYHVRLHSSLGDVTLGFEE